MVTHIHHLQIAAKSETSVQEPFFNQTPARAKIDFSKLSKTRLTFVTAASWLILQSLKFNQFFKLDFQGVHCAAHTREGPSTCFFTCKTISSFPIGNGGINYFTV